MLQYASSISVLLSICPDLHTMDGFDDLLAPSRQALESNPFASPFADPFGGRSSPDPWATPFGAHNEESAFGSSTLDHETPYSSVNPYDDTPTPAAEAEPTEPIEEVVKPPSDPLDSTAVAAQDDDEDNRPLGTLRSPGFRESIAPLSQAVEQPKDSILPPSENLRRTSLPSERLPPISSLGEETPIPTRVATPPSAIQAEESISPAIGTSSTIVSPLDRSSNVLENTLAGLSLGGVDVLSGGGGGWHSQSDDTGGWGQTTLPPAPIMTAPPSSVNPQGDEDSDDDKPISQTIKRGSQDDARSPVCFALSRSILHIPQ